MSAWRLLRRFWKVAQPYRRYIGIIGLFSLLGAPVPVLAPLLVKEIIDAATMGSGDGWIAGSALALIGLLGVSTVFAVTVGYCAIVFRSRVRRSICLELYLHLQSLSVGYYRRHETGYLMSRQQDDAGNLDGVMPDAFIGAGIEMIKGIAFLVMLFAQEWRLALGGCVLVVGVLLAQLLIARPLRRRNVVMRERWAEVGENLHQTLSGHTTILAAAAEKKEARRYAELLDVAVRANVRRDLYALTTDQMMGFVTGVAPTLIILAGALLIAGERLSVGGLFAFFMYLVQLGGAVAGVARRAPAAQSSLASLARIYEVLDTKSDIALPPEPVRLSRLRGVVAFEGVSFAYDGDNWVLEDLNFCVSPRTVVAIVGPSGAGKTTLAQLIARFYDPGRGRVTIDGEDLRNLDPCDLRKHIGIVPQDVFLFDRTVRENIALGVEQAQDDRIIAALSAANARGFVEELPEGLDSRLGERGIRLSGGQRQRLALARAALMDPRILILDEATSALDSRSETVIQENLHRLFEDRTAIVIAHRLSTVMSADLILVLDGGRIVQRGTHEELVHDDGLYRDLCAAQAFVGAPPRARQRAAAQ